MNDNKKLINAFESQLDRIADKKTKDWWENYLKHVIKFRGVNQAKLREEFKKWYKKERIDNLSLDSQLNLALEFFAEDYAEDKLAGILFLKNYLINQFDWKTLIPRFERLFEKNLIFDWNICDWFCVRVLGPMIEENGVSCAKIIAEWRTSKNLWQARASLVAFANLTKDDKLKDIIIDTCKALIKRNERFAKTSVGWILRELSKTDKNIVVDFIEQNKEYFSKESLSKATKQFSSDEKARIRGMINITD
jgi:3-methyladenine DNA glycosylase AlkD